MAHRQEGWRGWAGRGKVAWHARRWVGAEREGGITLIIRPMTTPSGQNLSSGPNCDAQLLTYYYNFNVFVYRFNKRTDEQLTIRKQKIDLLCALFAMHVCHAWTYAFTECHVRLYY